MVVLNAMSYFVFLYFYNALMDIPLKGSLYTLVHQSIVTLLFSYDHSLEQQ